MLSIRMPTGVLLAIVFVHLCSCTNKPMLRTITWDFTNGNDVTVVGWSEDMMQADGVAVLKGGALVNIRVSEILVISTLADEVFARKSGRQIHSLVLSCPKRSLNASVIEAMGILASCDYDAHKLQTWAASARPGKMPDTSFQHYYRGGRCSMFVDMRYSYDDSCPCRLKIELFFEGSPKTAAK